MYQQDLVQSQESLLATNKVLRNTYLLLGLTLIFSALMAGIALITGAKPLNPFVFLIGAYGLLFATHATSRSGWGLLLVFAFTGFMGYALGPILNLYIQNFSNGSQIVMTALGATGFIFFALSAYTLTSRKDFSYMGGFLFILSIVAMLAILASFFFPSQLFQTMISALFVLLSSGVILFQTSQIIHGGERNYILATVTLYVSIYNLFISLLQLLSAFSGRD